MVCGEANTDGADKCQKCEAALPKSAEYATVTTAGGGAGAVVTRHVGKATARYEQFNSAVQKARSGEWSRQELADWLQNIQSLLSEKASYLVNLIHASGYYEYQMDEVELCLSGIDSYDKGMEEIWLYVQEGDPGYLDRGLEMIWEGNEMINEAMRLNREFRRGLEDEWGYM